MRIIGGAAKGRRLRAPKGESVRPTAARVKESLFNILPRDFAGMTVLDLFAGTGNLSIEALSRGAQHATLVDVSPRSGEIMRENLRRLGFSERSKIWIAPVKRCLRARTTEGDTFDVIFLDPPYDKGLVTVTLELIAAGNLLAEGGIIVAEHSRREEVKEQYGALILNDRRHYGDTLLSFFTRPEK